MVFNRVLAAVAMPIAAVAVAAPAQADQFDYVSYLDNNGIYYSSVSDVIDLGKQLCSVARKAPTTGNTMAQALFGLLGSAGYGSSAEGKIILTAAGDNMCPDIWPRVKAAFASASTDTSEPVATPKPTLKSIPTETSDDGY